MTLIITCLTADCIVAATDSAIIFDDNPKKRIIDNAVKLVKIPYINSMISFYGDAEINGSTEYWLKKTVDELYGQVNNVKQFSDKFGEKLSGLKKCQRIGFHISGFLENEDNKEKHFFVHWSNEKEGNPEEAGNSFKIVSPSMEDFFKSFNYKYLSLFYNGDHKSFNIIFTRYKDSITELEKELKKDDNYYNPYKVERLLRSLMSLIISTCELLDYEHIGGNILSHVI